MKIRSSLLLLACLATSACAAHFHYTPTTSVVAPARAADCTFDILSARPDYTFDEIGILEGGPPTGARTVSDFRDAVTAQVCQVGGTAVLPEVNGHGVYIRAAVIRKRPSPVVGD